MKYTVAVTETRRRVVVVSAESSAIAHRRVHDAWQNCEIVLDENDFEGVEFHVTEASGSTAGLDKVERKG